MKIKFSNLLLFLFASGVIGLIVWKQMEKSNMILPIEYYKIKRQDIVDKKLIYGNLLPDKEVKVRPQMNGVIDELFVKVGQKVQKGDRIASIKVMPEPDQVEGAQRNLRTARINLKNEEQRFLRNKSLFEQQVIPLAQYEQFERSYKLQQEAYQSAENRLELILKGYTKNVTEVSNIITSTANGTVLELPLKEGASVTKRNNFNQGTVIASIANLENLMFKGRVNEYDIHSIHLGMPIQVNIGADKKSKLKGVINLISPQAVPEGGVMKFLFEAKILPSKQKQRVYSGISATAEVVLAEHKQVLAINEKDIFQEQDSSFIEILEVNTFRKIPITTGLSDGIHTELITQDTTLQIRRQE